MFDTDAPPMRVTATTTRFRPVLIAAPPESPTIPVFEILDTADARTLGDALDLAAHLELIPGTEMRVAFARDRAGTITGLLFGARVTPQGGVA